MLENRWILVGLAASLILGVYTWSCVDDASARSAMVQVDKSQDAAHGHAAQGEVYDSQAQAQAQVTHSADIEVSRLRAEVERLRSTPKPPDSPKTPGDPQPVPPVVDLSPLVAKQDELIKAQDAEIKDLKTEVATITLARDSYRHAWQADEAAIACLRAAHEAQVAAIRAERWKGRIEGFAVGLASGYVAGRLH